MEKIRPQNKWKRIISYYKPYKRLFIGDMFFALLGAGITLTIPLLIRYITNDIVEREISEAFNNIILIAGIMLVLVIIEAICNFFIGNYGHVMGAKMEYDMRNEIFTHYQKLSFSFFDNQKVGKLMSRITTDLFEISELFHHGPEDLVISTIKLVGSFTILMMINVKLAIAAFILVPIMFIFTYFLNKKMKRAFKRNRERVADINAGIEDNLSGIRVVKSFANEDIEIEKFYEGNNNFLSSKKISYKYMGTFQSGITAFTSLINIVVIITGALLIVNDKMNLTDLITFLLYINTFTEPVKKLINFTETFQNGIAGYERFLDVLAIEPDIKDKKNALALKNVKGDIVYENVSFRYNEDSADVISNVNLNIKAGEYLALVGHSGTGKTTLCSLLPRFYEVTSGRILIDGVDIRDIKIKDLRRNIGLVQQDIYLFAGTVLENIRYGKPDASEEEIVEAARKANAHDFIMDLPNGYDTNIGQRGVKLSGGQKQRLSIARVFLKNPSILIFDEATSSLDNESEKVVQESMEKLAMNRTTIVIAHRLTTVRNAERIIVLTDKGIEEEGTHEELLNKNCVYAGFYKAIE